MSKRRNSTRDSSTTPQQVRIIAGRWKGRKLPVVQKDDVRPTPNRVRETLFNWLQGNIQGSHCLDLFAGSGALGFESASREASLVTVVDNDHAVIELLKKQIELFDASKINLVCDDGIKYLSKTEQKFDIIYLDPPFSKFDLNQLLAQLENVKILKPQALVYVESPPDELPQNLPSGWQWWRQSKASQVAFGLIATS